MEKRSSSFNGIIATVILSPFHSSSVFIVIGDFNNRKVSWIYDPNSDLGNEVYILYLFHLLNLDKIIEETN